MQLTQLHEFMVRHGLAPLTARELIEHAEREVAQDVHHAVAILKEAARRMIDLPGQVVRHLEAEVEKFHAELKAKEGPAPTPPAPEPPVEPAQDDTPVEPEPTTTPENTPPNAQPVDVPTQDHELPPVAQQEVADNPVEIPPPAEGAPAIEQDSPAPAEGEVNAVTDDPVIGFIAEYAGTQPAQDAPAATDDAPRAE